MPPGFLAWIRCPSFIKTGKTTRRAGGGGNQEFIFWPHEFEMPIRYPSEDGVCGVRPTHLAFRVRVQSEDKNKRVVSAEADLGSW